MGRRSSATRIAGDSDHSQPRAQIASHHDRGNPISTMDKKSVQPASRHHKSYSDASDFAATPSRTFTDYCTSNGDAGPKPACSEGTRPAFSDAKPTFSEGAVSALSFYNYESFQAAAGDPRRRSDLDHRDYIKRSWPSPKRSSRACRPAHSDHTQQSSSFEIRDALLATFSECHKANQADQAFSKRESESRNLPRSSSVYARGLEPSELLQWKDGLRSSVSPPRRSTKETTNSKVSCLKSPSRPEKTTRMISHHSSPEKRVDSKSRDRAGRALSRDYTLVTMSPKKLLGPEAPPGTESPGAADFRDSLRSFMANPVVPARKSFASRLTDPSSGEPNTCRDVSVNVIARLMGLEETTTTSSTQQQTPSKAPLKGAHDAKSRGEKFFRGLVQFDPQTMRDLSPPPPAPSCQWKKHHLGYRQEFSHGMQEDPYQENYPAQYKMEQGLCCCEEDRDYEHLQQISRRPFEDEDYKEGVGGYHKGGSLPPKLADAHNQADDANRDAHPEVLKKQQPNQKKKMLWKILEAMRPKALRKHYRRRQAEPEVLRLTGSSVQPVEETQQQGTRVSVGHSKMACGAEKDETSRYMSKEETSRYMRFVKQVQEQQTESSNYYGTEGSVIAKPCIDETSNKVVVVKPVDRGILSNARCQLSSAEALQVTQVETASRKSNDEEKGRARRATQVNNEGGNLVHDQGKPTKPRVAAVETVPRSAPAEVSLESDCETNLSTSTTQQDKAGTVRESRKTRSSSPSRPNPRSRVPTPDNNNNAQGKQGRASSPEACSSLSRRSQDPACRGAGPFVGRKPQLAKGKKDIRPQPANPKAAAQLPKEETLKRRVSESSVAARLRGSLETESAENSKAVGKESVSIRAPGARARSSGAAKLKQQPKDGMESLGASLKDSEPGTGGPNRGSVKEPFVCQLLKVPAAEDVQKLERVCSTAGLSNHGTGGVGRAHEPQLLQLQVEALEVSEELTTPRGARLNFGKLEDKLAESMDRPSPVSILETNCFDEDLPLSPTSSSKHTVVPVQDADSVATSNDEDHESCVKDLEAYQDQASSATLEAEKYTEPKSTGTNMFQSYFEDPKSSMISTFQSYFEDVVKTFEDSFSSPGVSRRFTSESHDNNTGISDKTSTTTTTKPQSYTSDPSTTTMDEALLQSLHSHGMFQEEKDHLLLLDCLEEIMERILDSQSSSDLMLWAGLGPVCETPKGKQLERELWMEMQNVERRSQPGSQQQQQDICEFVHNLLLTNLLRCQGRQWTTFHADREIVGLDMERMIVGDLIEEAVGDLCALQGQKAARGVLPFETTRRQLFTN